jgi:uncharacterized protein with GYD domain
MNRRSTFALASLLLLPGVTFLADDAVGQQTAPAHHRYFVRVVYTTEGMKDLQKRSATAAKATIVKFLESAGCKLETWYFDYTESTSYAINDCPDEIAVATLQATGTAAGFARATWRPVLSAEDMDVALAKSLTTRPPQQQ